MIPTHRDSLGRALRDLRVSVTDRCNFRCPYCMPAEKFGAGHSFLKDSQKMNADEMKAILGAFVSLGVEKIRFTGGEPLLRADLPDLIRHCKGPLGVTDVAVTTNGWLLEKSVEALKAAGLDRLTVSLDSLDPATFGRMNGLGFQPERVLRGIALAREAGFPLKLNMVVQRGVNDGEILEIAAWARERHLPLRFIEFMDVGNHNEWSTAQVVPAREIVDRVGARWPLEALVPAYRGEVAARYRYLDGAGEIGLISAVTEPFCTDCNRARLSADGRLHTCLFTHLGWDVLKKWRQDGDASALAAYIAGIWSARRDRYSEERDARRLQGETTPKIEMSYIGG